MQHLPQQKEAIQRLQQYKVGALFMQPGTGKTLTAYTLASMPADVDYILWLTPFQVKDTLRKELHTYGTDPRIDIVGIETLSSSDREYLRLYNTVRANKTFIICDESIKIKNHDAIRTKRILELGKYASYRMVLNGTPITRNLLDIWAQFQFLSPQILNMSLAEFKATFCETVTITKRINGRKPQTREFIAKYHNVDYLYSLIKHYVYECDLQLTIDKKHENIDYIIDDDCLEEYNKLKAKYLDVETLHRMNNNIFLEMTMKMQHGYCCTPSKLKAVEQIIKNHNPEKTIIYTKFIASRQLLQHHYPDLQILTYGKHSLGLNLQKNNTTIYFDKTFDYAQLIQSEFRTYRTRQDSDCLYYHLTGNVGLETLMDNNIKKKISLLDYFKQVGIEQIKTQL